VNSQYDTDAFVGRILQITNYLLFIPLEIRLITNKEK